MCAPVVQGYGLTETCAGSFISVPDLNVSNFPYLWPWESKPRTCTSVTVRAAHVCFPDGCWLWHLYLEPAKLRSA